jgi:hypothetical protein
MKLLHLLAIQYESGSCLTTASAQHIFALITNLLSWRRLWAFHHLYPITTTLRDLSQVGSSRRFDSKSIHWRRILSYHLDWLADSRLPPSPPDTRSTWGSADPSDITLPGRETNCTGHQTLGISCRRRIPSSTSCHLLLPATPMCRGSFGGENGCRPLERLVHRCQEHFGGSDAFAFRGRNEDLHALLWR